VKGRKGEKVKKWLTSLMILLPRRARKSRIPRMPRNPRKNKKSKIPRTAKMHSPPSYRNILYQNRRKSLGEVKNMPNFASVKKRNIITT